LIQGNNVYASTVASNPIYIRSGTTHTKVLGNYVSGGGDTCIETVSYVGDTINSFIDIGDNDLISCAAHGVSVVGGQDIDIHDNHILWPAGRGVYVASETGPPATIQSTRVTVKK